MTFYEASMRNSSKILFWIAVIIVAGNALYHIYMFVEMRAAIESGRMSVSPQLSVSQITFAVMSSLGGAAIPLFGAAALWRADRWLNRRSVAEEEAE